MSVSHLLTGNDANNPKLSITVKNLTIEGKSSDQLSHFTVGASSEYRYHTIQSAINDALGTNSTIIVTPGTYTENLDLKTGGFTIQGAQSNASLFQGPVTVNGTVTGNLTSEVVLANLEINSTGNTITLTSLNQIFLIITGCTLLSSAGTALVSTNGFVFVTNTRFRNAATNMIDSNNTMIILINNVIDTDGTQNKILKISNNSFCIAFNNLMFDFFSFDTNSTGLVVGNCIAIGDNPAFTIDVTSISITSGNFVLSINGSSTDWVVGNGTILSNSNTLAGRNTVGAGITYSALTVA